MTNTASHPSRVTARPFSGRAIAALVIAVIAVVLPSSLAFLIAAAAIVTALASRSQLRAHPQMRGTWVSLSAFVIGVIVFVAGVYPWVLFAVLSQVG